MTKMLTSVFPKVIRSKAVAVPVLEPMSPKSQASSGGRE